MIAFVTLFLGLVAGRQTVELTAGPEVAAIELRLDGKAAGSRTAPPWRFDADLGTKLEPRRLEALAFDAERRLVGSAVQWLNLPRPPAEAEIVLAGGEGGRGLVATLTWESVTSAEPVAVRAFFDGQPLAVSDPAAIEIPVHDPGLLHFLRCELEFEGNLVTAAEATFGGAFTDRVDAEWMALPIELDRDDRRLTATAAAGRFVDADGTVLPVLAVDKGTAEVIVVRDLAAQPGLDRLLRPRRLGTPSPRFLAPLKKDQRLRFLSAFPERVDRSEFSFDLFPAASAEYSPRDGGLFWLLTQIRPQYGPLEVQRLADAVAVAGMGAAGRRRRRAVVLVLGPAPRDASQLAPADVAHYLGALGVPLVVWQVGGEGGATAWGAARPIDSIASLERATRDLARRLDRQRLAWIEGIHLPQSIRWTGGDEVRIVR